jgi:hypothetical protein
MSGKLLYLLFTHWILTAYAQEPVTYISSKEITVGSLLEVQYDLVIPEGEVLTFTPPVRIFPCKRIASQSNLKGSEFTELEIFSYSDTILRVGAVTHWNANFRLIPWDTGMLVLQPLPYRLNDRMGYFSSILIQSSFVSAKKGIRIYDIEESVTPLNKEFVFSEFIKTYGWIPLLILLFVGGVLLYKKFKRTTHVEPISLTLKQQTLQSIDKLAGKKQWESDQKTHSTELSFILRWYLSTRYHINLLERTSFETLLLLRALSLDEYLQIIIARVLTESDSVKFASNTLSEQEHLILIEQLREIIQLSSPIDISHV